MFNFICLNHQSFSFKVAKMNAKKGASPLGTVRLFTARVIKETHWLCKPINQNLLNIKQNWLQDKKEPSFSHIWRHTIWKNIHYQQNCRHRKRKSRENTSPLVTLPYTISLVTTWLLILTNKSIKVGLL